ncbi:MAG TPA: cytochrome P450 [Kineosporiaceae bacterium]|nr:cytochrome P450 [Kineosporiaceae bacterium]
MSSRQQSSRQQSSRRRPSGARQTPPEVPARPRRRHPWSGRLDAGGPTVLELLRAVPAIRRDPLGYLERMVAEHGDLVALPMPGAPVLLVNDPGAARQVLQDNNRAYGKQTLQYTALSAVTGNGLLTSDGEAWRARRRLVQPAFHRAGLDRVAAESVAAARRLGQAWSAAGSGPVDVDQGLQAAMLEVLGHTLFEADLAPAGERVLHAVDEALGAVMVRARSLVPDWLPTPARRRLRRATGVLDDVCAGLVTARRAAGVGPADPDLLALLLRSLGTEGGVSETDLRDELVTLVIAGHETVAACLTWTLHLLAGHPQVQAAVHAELDQVLAGREPGWSDLPRLPWLRACVDEALRLYPPAWVLTRRALAADELAGIEVPAGTLVIISPWLLHRRAQSWPLPDRFDPQRFAGEPPAAVRAGAYLPFGAGPRLCIGREFALVEAVLVLATLLRDRRVDHPAGRVPCRVDALVTLRPHGGLPLLVSPR